MAGKGFKDVYNLTGGIKAWQGTTAQGPVEMGMMFVKGDETVKEIVLLAYGMEYGLEAFYSTLALESGDPEVKEILTRLSRVEENHQKKLFELYLTLAPAPVDRKTFETKRVSEMMEGGFTTDEFLQQHRDTMNTVPEIVSIAMMLETQALDLYLRFSQKVKDEKSKNVLYQIGDEEKAHLEVLGRLLEKKI